MNWLRSQLHPPRHFVINTIFFSPFCRWILYLANKMQFVIHYRTLLVSNLLQFTEILRCYSHCYGCCVGISTISTYLEISTYLHGWYLQYNDWRYLHGWPGHYLYSGVGWTPETRFNLGPVPTCLHPATRGPYLNSISKTYVSTLHWFRLDPQTLKWF